MGENIERLFIQESREKKKIGMGVYKRASRKGFIRGGVKTASDFLSAKEKKALNSAVLVRNMYDDIKNIPTIKEIEDMDYSKAEQLIKYVKEKHTNKNLMTHWRISTYRLYGVFEKYNCQINKRVSNITKVVEKEAIIESSLSVIDDSKVDFLQNDITSEQYFSILNILDKLQNVKIKEENKKSFTISFNDVYTKPELENKLSIIPTILTCSKKYRVNMILEELY